MGEVVQFPEQIRIQDFESLEATKAAIRQCFGAVVGAYHGKPELSDMMFAMAKAQEGFDLMKSYWIQVAMIEAQK